MTKSKLQIHCEKLIDKLSADKRAQFSTLTNDTSRLKFVYALSEEVKYDLATWLPKDLDRAESLKTTGNKLFQQHDNYQAINVYNEALIRCPQDDLEGKKLYAILIANRSAVFFDSKQYEKVLQDVAFLKQYGHHPNPEKLQARETKALDALCQSDNSKVIEFEEDGTIKKPVNEELTWISKNITYPALSNKLLVKKDYHLGRYVVAKNDIAAGEIVAVEKPYASVIIGSIYRTNCANCTKSTNQIHACAKCCQAVYCSTQCLEVSKIYHQHECSILLTLFDAEVSVNNLLALRMITQRPLSQVISDNIYATKEKNVVIYKGDDYYNIRSLVRHQDARDSEELLHLTFMAAFLLKMLQQTEYFGCKLTNKDGAEDLNQDEVLVGELLLKYLQTLQYNAHEIFELQKPNLDIQVNQVNQVNQENYRTGNIGAGIYPSLALLNHACDPSVVRYNIKNTMVYRAIKPIKTGDQVYENYGPLYVNETKTQRINNMAVKYRFTCTCHACVEDWPLFGDIDQNILRVKCDCGAVIPTNKEIPTPSVACAKCGKDKNLLPVLTGLIPLEPKSQKAENFFAAGEFVEAAKLYGEMIETQLKLLAPPFGDMIQMQQRLKVCLLHNGNKKFDY